VTPHKKVSVLWLSELRSVTAVQCCFRTHYEHQPQHAKECGFGTTNQGLLDSMWKASYKSMDLRGSCDNITEAFTQSLYE